MRKFVLSRTFRAYLLALVSVLIAIKLRELISPGPDHKPGLFLVAAITLTTWYGGLWPGVVSLAIAALYEAWVLPPPGSFLVGSRDDILRLIVFVLVAGLITALYTARRHAEQQVALTKRRLNSALAAARIGCWEVDVHLGAFWVSSNLPDIYGHPAAEFASSYEGFFAYIHPEDRDFVRLATVQRGSDGTYFDIDHRVIDAAGNLRWVCTRGRIYMDAADKVERMVGAVYLLDGPPRPRSGASGEAHSAAALLLAAACDD